MDKKEIRFIDSHYNELFRIKDGGKIEIQYDTILSRMEVTNEI